MLCEMGFTKMKKLLLLCVVPLLLWGAEVRPALSEAEPVPLSSVRLLSGPFKERQELMMRELLSYDPDRLLHNFRVNAGLPSTAAPYGGWEHPTVGLRGHLVGHYLSACAQMYAATGDERFAQRATDMVTALGRCQDALGNGYLSAFPADTFDVLETKFFDGIWAPYYTIHKIMAGLLDCHEYTGNRQALDIAAGMGRYFGKRLSRLSPEAIEKMTRTDYKGNPVNEYGGIAASLLELYRRTGEAGHLQSARLFFRPWFVEPLAGNVNRLAGLHANTHIAQVHALAQDAWLTGERGHERAARNFWRMVTRDHSFVYGGNAFDEKFGQPGVEAAALTDMGGESCNTYNMLKLTGLLLRMSPSGEYADYLEHALYNHILASIAPDTGQTCYHLGGLPGHFKVYGTKTESMWCCTGTGMENPPRYAEAAYYQSRDRLWINLYLPSRVKVAGLGLVLRQDTAFPESESVRFIVEEASGAELGLLFRLPSWLAASPSLSVNGRSLDPATLPARDGYQELRAKWKRGDIIVLTLPMNLRVRPSMDDPKVVSFFHGPILLAGCLGRHGMEGGDVGHMPGHFHAQAQVRVPVPALPAPASGNWLRVGEGSLSYQVRLGKEGESLLLKPFHEVHHERTAVYWSLQP